MKLGMDGVLKVPYKFCCFRPDLPRGGSRAGQNRSRGPLLQRTSSDQKATSTNRMHSSDLEAFGKKCCYFWFHSEVKFLTCFLTSFWTWSFQFILMKFL